MRISGKEYDGIIIDVRYEFSDGLLRIIALVEYAGSKDWFDITGKEAPSEL